MFELGGKGLCVTDCWRKPSAEHVDSQALVVGINPVLSLIHRMRQVVLLFPPHPHVCGHLFILNW